jgi:hypothetical protein
MLDKLSYTPAPPAPSIPFTICGRGIAKRGWGKYSLARLGGAMSLGRVDVHKPSVAQVAHMLGLPVSVVRKARAELIAESRANLEFVDVVPEVADHHNGNGNGNGHAAVAPSLTWESLTSAQRSEFLAENFDAIWNELERVTS